MPKDYATIFETLNLDQATLQLGHGETITPQAAPTHRTITPMQTLPEFNVDGDSDAGGVPTSRGGDYRIVDTLGEGGMGVVSLAEQTALRRLVAVKEPKRGDDRSQNRMLDEAFIMGRMEHPNVVPAYSLGRRKNGQPLLVMKRVEGTSWDDVIAGKAEVPGGGEAELTWHLRVLLQVCNAIRYAHARRVVHRDIKPENVMIGEFGEVYLLDWGIAVSLDPDAGEGIPTIYTSDGIAGTPCFMAPEMTDNDATNIDQRTDVYLLGATLHLLLTGTPPHSGDSLMAVCMAAYKSEPQAYPETTPVELVDILHRAMARDKEDRFQTVAEFARAIEDYIEHRASYALSDAAALTLEGLKDDAEQFDSRLLEVEFAFRQALTIWSDNERARQGLQSTLERRIRLCIARDEVGAARTALEQLPWPNPELVDAVEALERELEARAERVDYLERFESDFDLRRGSRSRQRAVLVLGIGFAVLCFWRSWAAYHGAPTETPAELLSSFWPRAAIAGVGMALFWKKLVSNVANRRLVAYLIAALVSMFLLRVGAVALNPPVLFIHIAEIVVIGMTAFAISAASGPWLAAIAASAYVGALVAATISAEMWITMLALGIADLVCFGAMAWFWRPSATR